MSHRIVLPVFLLVSLAACAAGTAVPSAGAGAPTAPGAVERFLQLAGERDYVEMGWVFGTESGGPIVRQWPRPEVERRMYAIASVLSHDSYVIGEGSPVPGRIGRAERFVVVIHSGQNVTDVPIIAVLGPGGRWFVEQVDLEAITNLP